MRLVLGPDSDLEAQALAIGRDRFHHLDRVSGDDGVQRHRGLLGRRVQQVPAAQAGIPQKHGVTRAIRQPERCAGRERMVARHDSVQGLDGLCDDLKAAIGGRVEGVTDIRLFREHGGNHLAAAGNQIFEADAGMVPLRIDDQSADDAAHRLDRRDSHVTASQSAQILDLRPGQLEIPCHAPDMAEQHFAGAGEPHAARQPLEELDAEIGLQVQYLPVERRGGDVQKSSGLAHRPMGGDGLEIGKGPRPGLMQHAIALGLRHCPSNIGIAADHVRSRLSMMPAPEGLRQCGIREALQ